MGWLKPIQRKVAHAGFMLITPVVVYVFIKYGFIISLRAGPHDLTHAARRGGAFR